MSFDLYQLITNMLNGEPLHDAITCGIIFVCFYEFYKITFETIMSIFK